MTQEQEKTQAAILKFTRRRGRPKTRILRPMNDSGTPELVMKRLMGETAEALDLCLERGVITREQHWCGIHLRWLYTLRHGAPGTRAIDLSHIAGLELQSDDPEWRHAREKEYNDAMRKLADSGHALLVMNICLYNERPKFLESSPRRSAAGSTLLKFRDGLDILVQHWHREPLPKK